MLFSMPLVCVVHDQRCDMNQTVFPVLVENKVDEVGKKIYVDLFVFSGLS